MIILINRYYWFIFVHFYVLNYIFNIYFKYLIFNIYLIIFYFIEAYLSSYLTFDLKEWKKLLLQNHVPFYPF